MPAGDPIADARHPIAARYWAELSPRTGLSLFEIYPGNVIYRDRLTSAVNYSFTGTATQDNTTCASPPCLPASNMVRLFTDQTEVTYVDGNDDCYSNAGYFAGDPTCGGVLTAGDTCTRQHTFCAPIQMISGLTFGQSVGALPNVVLQIADPSGTQANRVLGCNDQDPSGDASGEHGLCAYTNAGKVDSPFTSDLVSPIQGDGVNNFACSFCYGNQFQANTRGVPGLENTVLSDPTANGIDTTLAAVNTDKLVIELENDENVDMLITVRFSVPALDASGSQLAYDDVGSVGCSPGAPCPAACFASGLTRVTINGASFGPPGECLTGAQPITSCPLEGTPGTGYSLGVIDSSGVSTPTAPGLWSDTRLELTPAAGTIDDCTTLQVTSPVGTTAVSDPIELCLGEDRWRSWTPTLSGAAVARIGAAFGVLTEPGGTQVIVMASGRTSTSDLTSILGATADTTLMMPVPTCANRTPDWTRATFTGTAPNRWGAAYAVANNQLFVTGGGGDGDTCINFTRRFTPTGPTSGTWQEIGNLPDMDSSSFGTQGLCNGTLSTVLDASGLEWLVLSGGTVEPVPNNSCDGGTFPNTARTWVMNPRLANPTWVAFSGGSQQDGGNGSRRFGAAATSNSSGNGVIVGGSGSGSLEGSADGRVSRVSVGTTGTPGFANIGTALPNPLRRYAGAAVAANGFIYLAGGSRQLSTFDGFDCAAAAANIGVMPAEDQLITLIEDLSGLWSTTLTDMPAARVEHGLVAATPAGGTVTKLYVIGGQNGNGAAGTAIFEYTP